MIVLVFYVFKGQFFEAESLFNDMEVVFFLDSRFGAWLGVISSC